jgi:hypothetical protein
MGGMQAKPMNKQVHGMEYAIQFRQLPILENNDKTELFRYASSDDFPLVYIEK